MRPVTYGKIQWKDGISFSRLSKGMIDFFQKTDLVFDRYHGMPKRQLGVFCVRLKGQDSFQFINAPWEDDPMLKPGLFSARWALLEPDGVSWGSFTYSWEENPGSTRENLGTKIYVLFFFFDGLLHSHRMSSAEFERTIKKYHLLKDLFQELDADELVAVDQNAASDLTALDCDPLRHRNKDLRFDKEGTQVLIRQLEEKRAPEYSPYSRINSDFIYVDP